ncbi:MAG: hypothetical protein ACOYEV_16800 [Candidatus Nanopelagicales bacterium]
MTIAYRDRAHTADGREPRRRLPGLSCDDTGSVSLFLAVIMVAMFLMIGLVVDGGGKARAIAAADDVAASAANAAGQAVDLAAYRSGGGDHVVADPATALASARRFLTAAGVDGNVVLIAGGRAIEVSTSATYQPVFLGRSIEVTGHAVAELCDVPG